MEADEHAGPAERRRRIHSFLGRVQGRQGCDDHGVGVHVTWAPETEHRSSCSLSEQEVETMRMTMSEGAAPAYNVGRPAAAQTVQEQGPLDDAGVFALADELLLGVGGEDDVRDIVTLNIERAIVEGLIQSPLVQPAAAAFQEARKATGTASISSRERERRLRDCFEAERSKLLRDLECQQRIVEQKELERAKAVKKAAEIEKSLRTHIKGLAAAVEKLERENKQLGEALLQQDALVDTSMEKLICHKQDIRELREAVRHSSARQKAASEGQKAATARLMEAGRHEREKLRRNLDTLRLALQDARLEWAEERNVYTRALDEATTTIGALDRLAKDLHWEKGTLGESLEVAQEEERDLLRALDAGRQTVASVLAEVDQAKRDAVKAEHDKQRQRVEHAKAMRAMEDRCRRAEAAQMDLELARNKALEEVTQLRQQLLNTAAEAADSLSLATNELEQYRSRVAGMTEELEVAARERSDTLAFLNRSNEQFKILVERYLGEQVSRERLRGEHWNMVEAMQKDFRDMIAQSEANVVTARKRVEDAQGELDYYRNRDAYQILQAEYAQTHSNFEEVSEQLIRLQAEHEGLTQQLQERAGQIQTLEEQLADLPTRYEGVTQELAHKRGSVTSLEAQVAELRTRHEAALQEVVDKNDSNTQLEQQLAEVRASSQAADQNLAEKAASVSALEQRVGTLQNQHEQASAQVVSLRVEVKTLQSENARLRTLLDQMTLAQRQQRPGHDCERTPVMHQSEGHVSGVKVVLPPPRAEPGPSSTSEALPTTDEAEVASMQRLMTSITQERKLHAELRMAVFKLLRDKLGLDIPTDLLPANFTSDEEDPLLELFQGWSDSMTEVQPRRPTASFAAQAGSLLRHETRRVPQTATSPLRPALHHHDSDLSSSREVATPVPPSTPPSAPCRAVRDEKEVPRRTLEHLESSDDDRSPSRSQAKDNPPVASSEVDEHLLSDHCDIPGRMPSAARSASAGSGSLERVRAVDESKVNMDGIHTLAGRLKERWEAVEVAAEDLHLASAELDRLREQKQKLMEEVEQLMIAREEEATARLRAEKDVELWRQEIERLQKYQEAPGEADGLRRELARVRAEEEALSGLVDALREEEAHRSERSERVESRVKTLEEEVVSITEDRDLLRQEVQRMEQECALCVDHIVAEKQRRVEDVAELSKDLDGIRRNLADVEKERAELDCEVRVLREATRCGVELRSEVSRLESEVEVLKFSKEKAGALSKRMLAYEAGLQAVLALHVDPGAAAADGGNATGSGLVEQVVQHVEALSSALRSKSEEAERLAQLFEEAQRDVAVAGDKLTLLVDKLATYRETLRWATHEMSGGTAAEADDAKTLCSAFKTSISMLQVSLAQEMGLLQRVISAGAVADTAQPPASGARQSLVEQVLTHLRCATHHAEALAARLEEVKANNLADRKHLQEEFARLRLQLEVWEGHRLHLENALRSVMHIPPDRPQQLVELVAELNSFVAGLRKEVEDGRAQHEHVMKDAEAIRSILEQELGELKVEVITLKRYCAAYEEALYCALGSSADGAEQGLELAVRLRDHVQLLKGQIAAEKVQVAEAHRQRAVEKGELLDECASLKQKASLFVRLTRILGDAIRSVLGLSTAHGMNVEAVGVENDSAEGQQHQQQPAPLTVEEVKALALKLQQFKLKVHAAAEERVQGAAASARQLKGREMEIKNLKDKMSRRTAELSSAREDARAASEQVEALQEKLKSQEGDISTLVMSMSAVSNKLSALQRTVTDGASGSGSLDLFASSGLSARGRVARSVDGYEGVVEEVEGLAERDADGGLAVEVLEQSLSQGLSTIMKRREERKTHMLAAVSQRRSRESSWEGLLSKAEDPLRDVFTGLQDSNHRSTRGIGAAASRNKGPNGEPLVARMLVQEVQANLHSIEGLERELETAIDQRRLLKAEVKRLERVLEEQAKAIASLSARNAELEVELESLPQDVQRARSERHVMTKEMDRLRKALVGEKDKLRAKVREQSLLINELTKQLESMVAGQDSQGVQAQVRLYVT